MDASRQLPDHRAHRMGVYFMWFANRDSRSSVTRRQRPSVDGMPSMQIRTHVAAIILMTAATAGGPIGASCRHSDA